jgi:hypothetical protein
MKTTAFISVFILFLTQLVQAQTGSPVGRDVYRIWTISTSEKSHSKPWGMPSRGGQVDEGALYEVKDSSILITRSSSLTGYSGENLYLSEIAAKDIDMIKLRKKGNQGLGILIGALSGLAVAVAMDVAVISKWNKSSDSYDDGYNTPHDVFVETPKKIALVAGSVGILGVGIGLGAAIGGAKISIPVNGNQKQFEKQKSILNDYSIKHQAGLDGKTFTELPGTVSDQDGNVYHTLALGGQVWMAENLKVSHYANGAVIPGSKQNTAGSGRLYPWTPGNDSLRICPAGWHVPSLTEWTSLYNSLGGEYAAGSKMAESFSIGGPTAKWWSSTETDHTSAKSVYLDNQTVGVMFTSVEKTTELSVRCIRD